MATSKLSRQPIKQLGMAGRLAADPEVFERRNQTPAEERLPLAIYGDPRSERIAGIDQPAGKGQSVSGWLDERMQDLRNRRIDLLFGLEELAAMVEVGYARIVRRALSEDEGGRLLGQRVAGFLYGFRLIAQLRGHDQHFTVKWTSRM